MTVSHQENSRKKDIFNPARSWLTEGDDIRLKAALMNSRKFHDALWTIQKLLIA